MNTLGNKLKVTIFGQSHTPAIGCVVDGLPAGFAPDMDRVSAFMSRRAPGQNTWSTPRKERDTPEILSGLVEGRTCGAPVSMVIRNADQRSKDYSGLKRTPRPSHADYSAIIKYGNDYDVRGGGQFSGRLTAPLCFAGALAIQLLEQRDILIAAISAKQAEYPTSLLTLPGSAGRSWRLCSASPSLSSVTRPGSGCVRLWRRRGWTATQ